MGCDIHAFTEIKIAGTWHTYTGVEMDRNYDLFAKMADVRNYDGITPISKPRGLPEDVAAVTGVASRHYGNDGHSHSWLSHAEVCGLEKEFRPLFGYLFGNYWSDRTLPKEVEDVRLVFWFDN